MQNNTHRVSNVQLLEPAAPNRSSYRAFSTSHAKKRTGETSLRLCLPDGTYSLKSWRDLEEALCSPPYTRLTLIFHRIVVTLQGRNLLPGLDLIQDDKLRTIQCYRPDVFTPPSDPDPCIVAIDRVAYTDYAKLR